MERLGLFGGSFNPPHLGHLAVAERLGEALGLDRVLWMPAATSPFKQDDPDMAAAAHRLAMARQAIRGNPRFRASDWEIRQRGVSYTVETLAALQQQHPGVRLVLLLGGDSLASFPRWHRAAEIVKMAEIAVYPRPGVVLPDDLRGAALGAPVQVVQAPPLDLSSTWLRAEIRAGRSVRYLVPEAVRRYLTAHALYR